MSIASDSDALSDALRGARSQGDGPHALTRLEDALGLGERVAGRFLVRRKLGSGAHGSVYAAYDNVLEREVAITRLGGGREKMLHREAKALARLRHPSLVDVHELFVDGADQILVMELVRGEQLGAWLKRDARSRDEILGVFIQLVDGLAGLHDAGLVHLDFKPSNVIVSEDGVAKIVDLGLAAPVGSEPGRRGTPRYMAPEQSRGTVIDGRADQYALCIALRDALDRSGSVRVPRRVEAAIERGSAADRATRFASMAELRHALAPPSPKRGRWIAVGVLGTAAIAVGGFGLHRHHCETLASRSSAVWNSSTRARVTDALGVEAETNVAMLHELDEHARQWSTAVGDACRSRAPWERQPDANQTCHRMRLARLQAVVERLADPQTAASNARQTVRDLLVPAAACDDAVRGVDWFAHTDAAAIEPVLMLREQVERARVPCELRDVDTCSARLDEITADASEVATCMWSPHVRLLRGIAFWDSEDRRRAAYEDVREAAVAAEVCGLPRLELEAKIWLVWIAADGLGDYEAAQLWAEQAQATAARAMAGGGTAPKLHDTFGVDLTRDRLPCHERARLLGALAAVSKRSGDTELTVQRHRDLLAHTQACLGDAHPATARAHSRMARVLTMLGRSDEAQVHAQQAVEVLRVVNGTAHPSTAVAEQSLAQALAHDDPDRALSLLESAAQIHRRGGVATLKSYVGAVSDQGIVLSIAGRHPEARTKLLDALQVVEPLDPEHPVRAELLNNLAMVEIDLEEHGAALGHLDQALPLLQDTAPGNRVRLNVEVNRARALFGLGRHREAGEVACSFVEARRGMVTGFDLALINTAHLCAKTRLADGEADRAWLEPLVDALPPCDETPAPIACWELRLDYAQLLGASPERRDEARRLEAQARRHLAAP